MLNPILSFSATRRMRSFRMLVIAGAYVAVMLGVALVMLRSVTGSAVSLTSMHAGAYCYLFLIVAQFALLVLIAPALSSGAIAGERERQTLELLLVTNTGPLRIVWGKVMESFAALALLIVCGLPVMCMPLLTGGITFLQVLMGEAFLLCVAFGAVCVGVFTSSVMRATMMSTIASYLCIGAIGVLTALPMITGYPLRITNVLYDAQQYRALTPAGALAMISPFLMMNPGFGVVALIQANTRLLTSYLDYRGWGRLYATWLMMDRANPGTVALCSGLLIVAVGLLLVALAALILRRGKK